MLPRPVQLVRVPRSESGSWRKASLALLIFPAAIAKRAEGDVLKGLDGRPIRLQGKRHAALNYLCGLLAPLFVLPGHYWNPRFTQEARN